MGILRCSVLEEGCQHSILRLGSHWLSPVQWDLYWTGEKHYPDADTVCRTPTTYGSVHTHHQTIQQAHHPKSLNHPQDSLLACNFQLGWSCVGCLIVQMVISADTACAGMPTFVPGAARGPHLAADCGKQGSKTSRQAVQPSSPHPPANRPPA